MKLLSFSLCLAFSLSLLSFKSPLATAKPVTACDSTPELNQQIISYVNAHIKKMVGRGECWDLAAEPLNLLGAAWDKEYKYGNKVDYRSDCIFPGDIIQFEGVKLKYKTGNITHTDFMTHHTAVIYQVNGKGEFIIAQQNTGDFGRKVGLSALDLKNVVSGHFIIYQPYK